MAKKKIKWEVSKETDKDIKTILYKKSCELCGTRGAGKHPMPNVCVKCITANNSPNFRLAAKYKKEK